MTPQHGGTLLKLRMVVCWLMGTGFPLHQFRVLYDVSPLPMSLFARSLQCPGKCMVLSLLRGGVEVISSNSLGLNLCWGVG